MLTQRGLDLTRCFSLSSYNRWLCQARAEDLSDIASLKALYQTGKFMVLMTLAMVMTLS